MAMGRFCTWLTDWADFTFGNETAMIYSEHFPANFPVRSDDLYIAHMVKKDQKDEVKMEYTIDSLAHNNFFRRWAHLLPPTEKWLNVRTWPNSQGFVALETDGRIWKTSRAEPKSIRVRVCVYADAYLFFWDDGPTEYFPARVNVGIYRPQGGIQRRQRRHAVSRRTHRRGFCPFDDEKATESCTTNSTVDLPAALPREIFDADDDSLWLE